MDKALLWYMWECYLSLSLSLKLIYQILSLLKSKITTFPIENDKANQGIFSNDMQIEGH